MNYSKSDYKEWIIQVRNNQVSFDAKSIGMLCMTLTHYRSEGEVSMNMCDESFDVIIKESEKGAVTEIKDESALVFGLIRIKKKGSYEEQIKKTTPYEKWKKDAKKFKEGQKDEGRTEGLLKTGDN